MNNEMKIFNNEEFGNIRTVTIGNEPWLCLSDICKALSLSQPSKVRERLNEKGVHTIPTLTKGGTQNLLYVNESNLYKTIFQSRKPSAEKFTDWVTEEILLKNNKSATNSDNAIILFNNDEFGNIRTTVYNHEPYFCLIDICKALEIGNASQALTRLKSDGVITNEVIDSLNRKQQAKFINESNLYRLIFQSRKPSAEKFTDWVTEEVLPTLRKTGSYSMPGNTNQQIALLAQGHMELVQDLEVQKQIIQSQQQDIEIIKERLNVVGAYDNEWMLQNIKSATASRVMSLTADPTNQVLWSRYFFAGIYKMLKAVFRVSSLSSIPVNEYESVLHIIKEWTPTNVFLEQRLAEMKAKKDKNLLPDKKVIALLQYMNETNNGTVNPFASI